VVAFDASLSSIAPGFTAGWDATLTAISAAVDTLDGMQGATNPLTSEPVLGSVGCQVGG